MVCMVIVASMAGAQAYMVKPMLDGIFFNQDRAMLKLRNILYGHIQSLPLSFFHTKPTGELISRIISDVTLIQGAVSNVLVGILKDTCQVLFLIGVIFYQDWRMASIAMISLPLVIYPTAVGYISHS
jgi:subfamily B ATP-binding cassette protein MsbA